MSFILSFVLSFFIHSAEAQTNFAAVVINNGQTLSITLVDHDIVGPYEAGLLWKSMVGNDQRKMIDLPDFKMTCQAIMRTNGEPWGSCKIKIPMDSFTQVDSKLVFKKEGSEASRLNRYFYDSAYVSMQRGAAWLSAFHPRRQFYFGLEEILIHY